nr:hypothetical protein [uncultured Roseococcus sp.]
MREHNENSLTLTLSHRKPIPLTAFNQALEAIEALWRDYARDLEGLPGSNGLPSLSVSGVHKGSIGIDLILGGLPPSLKDMIQVGAALAGFVTAIAGVVRSLKQKVRPEEPFAPRALEQLASVSHDNRVTITINAGMFAKVSIGAVESRQIEAGLASLGMARQLSYRSRPPKPGMALAERLERRLFTWVDNPRSIRGFVRDVSSVSKPIYWIGDVVPEQLTAPGRLGRAHFFIVDLVVLRNSGRIAGYQITHVHAHSNDAEHF